MLMPVAYLVCWRGSKEMKSDYFLRSHLSQLTYRSQQPINFLHLLSPTAAPPYSHFITRIVKSSDQQASIFLQQKLKIADAAERKKIVDAVSQRGVEMMVRFVRKKYSIISKLISTCTPVDEPIRQLGCPALLGASMRGRRQDENCELHEVCT